MNGRKARNLRKQASKIKDIAKNTSYIYEHKKLDNNGVAKITRKLDPNCFRAVYQSLK